MRLTRVIEELPLDPYRGAIKKFEVQYPKDWTYDENPGEENCIAFSDGHSQDWNAAICVHNSSYVQVKQEILSRINQQVQLDIGEENLSLNGIAWAKLIMKEKNSSSNPIVERYFAQHQGKTYELRTSYQMLSTFKFTK